MEVSSEGVLISLRGGTGVAGFSRGKPSILCSSRALTRKSSALRGKADGEKRLQLGTKKWGRSPWHAWFSRAPRRCMKQVGSFWRSHMESLNLTGEKETRETLNARQISTSSQTSSPSAAVSSLTQIIQMLSQRSWGVPDGKGVEEGGFPVVRAEVVQLFGITLFQALDQRLEEH